MADINDLAQKLAYYQAGGKDPGQYGLDKFNAGLDMVGSTIKDVLAIKKAQYENQKTQAETKHLGAQTAELTPTPVSAYMKPAAPAGTAGIDGNPVTQPQPPQIDYSKMSLKDMDTMSQANLRNAQADYYKSGSKATSGQKEDLMPVSKIMTLDGVQKILPNTTPEDYAAMTIGGLKQLTGGNKQADLNSSRQDLRDQARDNMVLNLRGRIETNPFLNKLKEQNLGLDVTGDIADLVKNGNTVGAAALGIKEAKGLGEVGVMTERDVTRYITSKQLSQRAGDILSTWLKGVPSQATQEEIAQINGVLHDKLISKINDEYGQYVDLLANNFNIPREEAARRLAINLPARQPLAAAPIAAPQAGAASGKTRGGNSFTVTP